MGSYAILGATGHVGGTILRQLLENPDNELHLYVRSKKKITASSPGIEHNPRVKIYEGDLDDVGTIQDCIGGTKAVFLAVALSENLPGCSIAMDTARVVVEALNNLRQQSHSQAQRIPSSDSKSTPLPPHLPRLVVLSSSSVSQRFWTGVPSFVHSVLYNANRNIYVDLEHAEEFLRSHTWLTVTFVKPGGLVDDIRRGHKLDTQRMHTPMSFGDLAAGMIEVADSSGSWDGLDVSIVPAQEGQGASMGIALPYALVKGLTATYLPGVYMVLRNWVP